MANYSFQLQTVIHQMIVAAVAPGVIKVVDHPLINPAADDFPFVQIGDGQALGADVTGSNGTEQYLDLHAWSRKRGKAEVKGILEELRTAFHGQTLTVPGLSSAHCYVDAERVLDDPDGLTRHGILTLKILCHE